MDYIYPRLARHAADQLISEQSGMNLIELREASRLGHPLAAPAATGGRAAGTEELAALRGLITEIADEFGFPSVLSAERQAEFDRVCGTQLFASMEIVPADAAISEVWSFIALVLAPEVAPWRFVNRTPERLRGGPRNTFQRLWWRAWSLGPDLAAVPPGAHPLGEDDFVQIMERPTLGGNRVVAASIRDAIWRADERGDSLTRSDLVRGLTKRVLALKSHLALDALDEDERDAVLDKLVGQMIS
ncbi:hypothetical protein [Agromyces sp. NPDC058064]|uniref:hypothetical protein n=1 Tax=Agromyces sp. NPDC058064 TaxID=3346322 RepID=UPI0036DC456F